MQMSPEEKQEFRQLIREELRSILGRPATAAEADSVPIVDELPLDWSVKNCILKVIRSKFGKKIYGIATVAGSIFCAFVFTLSTITTLQKYAVFPETVEALQAVYKYVSERSGDTIANPTVVNPENEKLLAIDRNWVFNPASFKPGTAKIDFSHLNELSQGALVVPYRTVSHLIKKRQTHVRTERAESRGQLRLSPLEMPPIEPRKQF